MTPAGVEQPSNQVTAADQNVSIQQDNDTDIDEPSQPTDSENSIAVAQSNNNPKEYAVISVQNSTIEPDTLSRYGDLGTVAETSAELTMPQENVSKVETLDWVYTVREQRTANEPDADNYNTSSVGARALHKDGINGDDVKIGIIGDGARVTDVPYENQVRGVKNFKDNGLASNPAHDTAALEQVSEVAPGADLYITGIDTTVGFSAATDYLIEQDVDIILTELAFYTTPADGSSIIAQDVERASNAGITVVSPAGNSRLSHYKAPFSDPDADGLHNFEGVDETNRLGGDGENVRGGSQTVSFILTWSDWDSEQVSDYDMYLYNEETETFVAGSERSQVAGAGPWESLQYSTTDYEPLSLVVFHRAGDTTDVIELYGPDWPSTNEFSTPQESIVPPATAKSAVSVAAYNSQADRLAGYSAAGPINNRPGITVTGPSHLPVSPYDTVFTGTSGAGPYIAGTVALMQDASADEIPPTTVQKTLRETASNLPRPARRSGGGLVNATAAVDAVSAQTDFDIQHERSSAGNSGPPFTEDFAIETTGESTFRFGPEAATRIQISKKGTNEQVTLTPENAGEKTYSANEVAINANDIIEDNETAIEVFDPNIGEDRRLTVAVEGDVDMFRNDTFAAYTIAITNQTGTPLATTEPQIHGVRYEVETLPDGIQYNGSAIAVARDEEVQPNWHVELQQMVNGDHQTIREFQNVAGSDYFIASVEGTEFNDSKRFRINIYQNEPDPLGQRLASLFLLRIDENARVTGPIGDRAPGDGSESQINVSLEVPATLQPDSTVTITAEVTNRDVPEASGGFIALSSVPAPLPVTSDSENTVFLGFGGNPAPATGETVSQVFEIAVAEDAAVDQEVTLTAEASLQSSSTEATTTTTKTVTIGEKEGPVQRFDTNGEPGIQRDEVIDAIVSFNNDSTVGGEEVSRSDIVTLIVEFNN